MRDYQLFRNNGNTFILWSVDCSGSSLFPPMLLLVAFVLLPIKTLCLFLTETVRMWASYKVGCLYVSHSFVAKGCFVPTVLWFVWLSITYCRRLQLKINSMGQGSRRKMVRWLVKKLSAYYNTYRFFPVFISSQYQRKYIWYFIIDYRTWYKKYGVCCDWSVIERKRRKGIWGTEVNCAQVKSL